MISGSYIHFSHVGILGRVLEAMQLCEDARGVALKIATLKLLICEEGKLQFTLKMLLLKFSGNSDSLKRWNIIFILMSAGAIHPRTSKVLAISDITPHFVGKQDLEQ